MVESLSKQASVGMILLYCEVTKKDEVSDDT